MVNTLAKSLKSIAEYTFLSVRRNKKAKNNNHQDTVQNASVEQNVSQDPVHPEKT